MYNLSTFQLKKGDESKKVAEQIVKALTKSENPKNDITLSKILNVIDGCPERTGQIIIFSANNPEKLNPVLIRPGRIDCIIHFKKCTIFLFIPTCCIS